MITRRFHLACEMVRANKMLVCGACSHMQAKHLSDFSTASNYQFSYNPIDIQKRFHGRHRYTNPDVMPSALHNVQSIRAKWVERFRDMQIPEPDVSAELIVAHVLGCQTLAGVAQWQIVPKTKTDMINDLCKLRLQRMPVQYIIEEWDFRDLVLQMKPPVLIPRPETEELITYIKNYIAVQDLPSPNKILEIGCGSGAIILSLAKEFPSSFCTGVDKCAIACELTSKNANNCSLTVHVENVEFTDDTVEEAAIFQCKYDIVVSNPPYIKSAELKDLAPEITDFEDVSGALDGGETGLKVVEAILRNARHMLNPNGLLWLEVDSSHPDVIRALTDDSPNWKLKYIKTYKDFLDRNRFCLLSHTN